jgi:DNA-binding CsgD family transcriptional regulator
MADSKGRDEDAADVAVIVSDADGAIVELNSLARDVVGEGAMGQLGWDVVPNVPESADLPCHTGCTCRIVASGHEHIRANDVTLRGEHYRMSCVPVHGAVVTTLVPLRRKAKTPAVKLTPREVDVLRLLAEGLTTAEAALRIGVSESTVRTHVEHMRDKLGVNTRAALVAHGFLMGYL